MNASHRVSFYSNKTIEQLLLNQSLKGTMVLEYIPKGDNNDFLRDSLVTNGNLIAVNHPIEEAFLEEKASIGEDNGDLLALYNTYITKWKEELNCFTDINSDHIRYSRTSDPDYQPYEEFMPDDELANVYEDEIALWHETVVPKLSDVQDMDQAFQLKYSRYQMEMYRAKALNEIYLFNYFVRHNGWTKNEFGWVDTPQYRTPIQ